MILRLGIAQVITMILTMAGSTSSLLPIPHRTAQTLCIVGGVVGVTVDLTPLNGLFLL